MWILEKYDDITLKRGIANLEGPIAYLVFLTISINFHKPMSIEYIFSIAGVFTVAHICIYIIIYTYTVICVCICGSILSNPNCLMPKSFLVLGETPDFGEKTFTVACSQ